MSDLFGEAKGREWPAGRSAARARRAGMGSHQGSDSESEVWLTPRWLLDALGPFDLDPCAAPEPRPWLTAATHFSKLDGGLIRPWHGRVWLNPPYGTPAVFRPWMVRMAEHGRGIALIFARTETEVFHSAVWPFASAMLFMEGRIHFCHPDGTVAANNSGAPSVLVAYGRDDAECLAAAAIPGALVGPARGTLRR